MSSHLLTRPSNPLQVPGDPEEPTFTLVLTSPRSSYVDIRVFKYQPQPSALGSTAPAPEILQWAFAGTSETSHDDNGRRFTTWHHWVDSCTNDPALDKGEMITLPDGDVLEKGVMLDSETGEEMAYEELWTEVPFERTSPGGGCDCIVLKTRDGEDGSRGMVVKVGGWCQGIVKSGECVTVERWEWVNMQTHSTNRDDGWEKRVRIGKGKVPCEEVLVMKDWKEGSEVHSGGVTWVVDEVLWHTEE